MKNPIQRFKEINEFFETAGFETRTDLPDFFIFSLNDIPKNSLSSMKPYQKDFYHITLVLKAKKSTITIDEQNNHRKENYLFFLSTEHIYSWQTDFNVKGYTVFFKPSFINFYAEQFETDFSFFDLADKNIIGLTPSKAKEISAVFAKLQTDYKTPSTYREKILQTELLSLLYKFKEIQEDYTSQEILPNKKQAIVLKFKNLVNNLYISTKQVGDYAAKLFVSANSLNAIVKETTGKTAKEIINDKVIQESKKMLLYTSNDIAQIAFTIGFDEPTHFIRFFKTYTKLTPKEFRTQKM
ncbi:MAG TPA: helix-turn-helix domain-containing protein [Flavobacterium sp.]|nr:helix-turn-helix domain-containing protein [Flavobacterium sp.]